MANGRLQVLGSARRYSILYCMTNIIVHYITATIRYLQVLGSPQHLKSVHGGGYRLEVKGPEKTAGAVRELVARLFPGTTPLDAHGGYQVFEISKRAEPGRSVQLFALSPVFAALDQAKADLGVETYTLSQTTLEQVFLNIAAVQDAARE